MNRVVVMLIAVIPFFARVAVAEVDLSQSTVSSDLKTVPAGTVVTVNVVLKNSGDTPSHGTDVRVRFPHNGFLVRIDELPKLKRDDDEREVEAVVNIPEGGEYPFSFDLLASRKEAQHTLSSDIEVRNFLADARLDTAFSIKISSAPSTAGVVIGGLRFHPAAFWVLGWMICGGLFFVWLRFRLQWLREHPKSSVLPSRVRRLPALALVALIMAPVAFLMVAAGLAWRDLQSLTSWKEAQATILDRREVIKTETRKEPGKRRQTSTTRTPEFALKYQAGEHEIISSGFDTGTSLHIGGQVIGKAAMEEWVAGKTIPCWYDPADPGSVVVRRGFGGAYIFFLIPLPILWFGLRQLQKVNQAVRQLDELDSTVG
ncbi:DUF3592 domain-containing protein [bacterium]|nr:DUF3592 domain-containing protein [bacterium]